MIAVNFWHKLAIDLLPTKTVNIMSELNQTNAVTHKRGVVCLVCIWSLDQDWSCVSWLYSPLKQRRGDPAVGTTTLTLSVVFISSFKWCNWTAWPQCLWIWVSSWSGKQWSKISPSCILKIWDFGGKLETRKYCVHAKLCVHLLLLTNGKSCFCMRFKANWVMLCKVEPPIVHLEPLIPGMLLWGKQAKEIN